jgi:hypothetical protein
LNKAAAVTKAETSAAELLRQVAAAEAEAAKASSPRRTSDKHSGSNSSENSGTGSHLRGGASRDVQQRLSKAMLIAQRLVKSSEALFRTLFIGPIEDDATGTSYSQDVVWSPGQPLYSTVKLQNSDNRAIVVEKLSLVTALLDACQNSSFSKRLADSKLTDAGLVGANTWSASELWQSIKTAAGLVRVSDDDSLRGSDSDAASGSAGTSPASGGGGQ